MDNDDYYTPFEGGEDVVDGVPLEAKPKRRTDKPNPFLMCISACFSKYYPRRRKRAWTDAGKFMRFIMGIATLLHFAAFAFCLLLVGPISSSFNLFLFF